MDEPRILTDLDYRILAANKAYRDAYAPHGSVVGRHCYEVSHHYAVPCDEAGESCPRRAALVSRRTEQALHIHHTPRGDEHVQVELNPVRDASGEVRYFVERMQSLPTARAAASSEGLAGRAPRFREMLELVARVAPSETSVLLLGETGTGKEMVARLVHESSRRATAPFVAVDCSGLTETLFESELFGHEKGAFTGATARKLGLVEAASGGTLFLDEVGDIPLAQQVKLLRLIESSSYRRVGGVTPLRADFRLVAATHRDLRRMVLEGSFRSDLYYRISAYPIPVPTLRERRDDILLLAESLLARVRPGRPFVIDEAARRALVAYDYPGNVRELRNIVERASLLADDDAHRTAAPAGRGRDAGRAGRCGCCQRRRRDLAGARCARRSGTRWPSRWLAMTAAAARSPRRSASASERSIASCRLTASIRDAGRRATRECGATVARRAARGLRGRRRRRLPQVRRGRFRRSPHRGLDPAGRDGASCSVIRPIRWPPRLRSRPATSPPGARIAPRRSRSRAITITSQDARTTFSRTFGSGAAAEGYFARELDGWLVIGLDSHLSGDRLDQQYAWLEATLAAHSDTHCTLAMWHTPLFSSGLHRGAGEHMRRFWALLDARGADVVLGGHEHFYEAFEPLDAEGRPVEEGIRSFVVGTGARGCMASGTRRMRAAHGS